MSTGVRLSTVALVMVVLVAGGRALLVQGDGVETPSPRPHHTWDTLPVFFHSANASGPWSDAAAKQIARYPMATMEKDHAMRVPGGGTQSEEIAGPAACRQVNAVNGSTDTFFYLNSVIDWHFTFSLHAKLVANPSWRLRNSAGGDLIFLDTPGLWGYNLSNPDMRAAWVAECVDAVKGGCTGCFIDKANVNESISGWPQTSTVPMEYRAAHLQALTELSEALAPTGNYAIFNHLGVTTYKTNTMMIEDFAATEKCINTLQTIAARGLTAQAHAGNLPEGNTCEHGDTNAMAAFLIGAGNYSYYHCSAAPRGWSSNPAWPAERDFWLDWLPEYDYPLGSPLGLATTRPSTTGAHASLWSRDFASGTRVEFDGGNGRGTIWWAHGVVQSGGAANLTSLDHGCRWESM